MEIFISTETIVEGSLKIMLTIPSIQIQGRRKNGFVKRQI